MKVKDLIDKLRQFDPEVVVALGDWNEEYCGPSVEAAEHIEQKDGPDGRMVVIG